MEEEEGEENDRKRLDRLIQQEERERLDEFLKRFLLQPHLLRDMLDYIELSSPENGWLRRESQERPFYWLWFESYKRLYPRDIIAAHEFHQFSLHPVGKLESDKYGVIDLVLQINYSNIKGFAKKNKGVKGFLTDSSLYSQTLEKQLYTSGKRSFDINPFSLLNPPLSEWRSWRIFHLKMRALTFHFLHWLIERLDGKKHQELLFYGYEIGKRDWRVTTVESIGERLEEHSSNLEEEKIQFLLPHNFSLVERDTAIGVLREISLSQEKRYKSPDRELVVNEFFFTPGLEEEREYLNDFSKEISLAFKNRCLSK